MLFVLRLIGYNSFINLIMILVKMRWKTHDKLIEKCTYTVNISPPIMSLSH